MSDQAPSSETPPAMDYDEHNRTYDMFIFGAKWGTILTAIILILMAIFLL